MTNTKKILITTESREIFIMRANGKSDVRGFCDACAAEVDLTTLDRAVSLSGLTTIEIVRRVETGEMHFWETASGHLFICKKSLPLE